VVVNVVKIMVNAMTRMANPTRTSSSAFLPEEADFSRGLHRMDIFIDSTDDGDDGIAVRAYPYLAKEEVIEDMEIYLISREVQGIELRVYNFKDEAWEDEWPNTNDIPARVEISLYMDPVEEFGEPIILKRAVEIPLGTTNWLDESEVKAGNSARAPRINEDPTP